MKNPENLDVNEFIEAPLSLYCQKPLYSIGHNNIKKGLNMNKEHSM